MTQRNLWTADQVRRALVLYLTTPFGRIHNSNPQIVQLAQIIGRSASAVALKMSNLAALDDSLDRQGMANASNLDRQIWQEYLTAPEIISNLPVSRGNLNYQQTQPGYDHGFGEGADIVRQTKQRKGQELFRQSILVSYQSCCALTKVDDPKLLVASHILGWAESPATRMDPSNGICLNPLHDKAFDKHLISFDVDYQMLVSKNISKDTQDALNDVSRNRLRMPNRFLPSQDYLSRHRARFLELQA